MQGKRERILSRWGGLKTERSSWDSHWREVAEVCMPRAGRFESTDRNRGDKRHHRIYDNAGIRARGALSSGLMANATSPARPWFRLGLADPDLAKFHPVKEWLHDSAERVSRVFQRSNTYRALHQVYDELAAFGTGVSVVVPDFENVIHHHPLTCGEYALAQDWQGRVNTLYREFERTVGEVVREFGFEQCSTRVQTLYKRGGPSLDKWITIIHAIEPRDPSERDYGKSDAMNMPWRSCYIEAGGQEDKVLRESGFERFPVLAPRWIVTGSDIYGTSPGMEALGDMKQLQQEQLRKSQGIDHQTNPALQIPVSMKNRELEMFPGGLNYYDGSQGPTGGIRRAYEVDLRLDYLLEDIRDCRDRINGAFFRDLFMMFADAGTNTRMTATEVAERHEEKLIMLGPVLERLHNELLEPLVDLTFHRLAEAGGLLPPPPDLEGADLSVEFISMLAQAQRAIGTNGVDRFVGNLGAVAQMKPEVLDKFDADEWADSYADMLGVDPALIVPTDEVQSLRKARNDALAAKEQAAAMQQSAGSVKDLAAAESMAGGDSGGADVLNMFSGYGASPLEQ